MRRVPAVLLSSLVLVACASSARLGVDSPDALSRRRQTTTDPKESGGSGVATGSTSDSATTTREASPGPPGDDAGLGLEVSGEATYYATGGAGACGLKPRANDLMVAAMNKPQYAKSVCGKCAQVTGPKGTTVKVRIVDLCPGCRRGDLDLSKQAFGAIAALSTGRVRITWHFVPC